MRKLFNWIKSKFTKKPNASKDFLASIGYTYIKACENDVAFRIRMEKTTFGKAVKQHIEELKGL